MITVLINGVAYNCVSSLEPYIDTEYFYDETTLDGKRHRKVKGIKTNYKVVFFNDQSGDFYSLKRTLSQSDTVALTVPTNATETKTDSYYPVINSFEAKGMLNGKFYHNLLDVSFDKVDYDAE